MARACLSKTGLGMANLKLGMAGLKTTCPGSCSSMPEVSLVKWTREIVVKKLEDDVDWTDGEVSSLLESELVANLDETSNDDQILWTLIQSKFDVLANWGFFRRTTAFFPQPLTYLGGYDAAAITAAEEKVQLLKGALEQFGGDMRQSLDKGITHCVCYIPLSQPQVTFAHILSSLDFVHDNELLLKDGVNVVLHEWVMDCIRCKREVPVAPYDIRAAE